MNNEDGSVAGAPEGQDVRESTILWIWRDLNGVIHTRFKPGAEITIDELREAKRIITEMSGGAKVLLLSHPENRRQTSRETRSFAMEQGKEYIRAHALLQDSMLTSFLATLYVRLTKASFPVKAFDDENDALLWLSQFDREK